jgi:hypothetical protein
MPAIITIQRKQSTAPPPVAPTITSTSPLPGAVINTPYTYTFTATGGTTPYTWAGTSLPAGLTLSSAGVLSGTPTTTATSSLSVTVTGGGLTSAAQLFSLTVNPAISTTWHHGDVITLTLPAGLASFGSKKAQTPDIYDFGQDGPGVLNNAYSNTCPYLFTGANAQWNITNRMVPFWGSSNVLPINAPDPYTKVISAGCFAAYFQESIPPDTGQNAAGMFVTLTNWWNPGAAPFNMPTDSVWSVHEWYMGYGPDGWNFAAPFSYQFTGTFTAGSPTVTGLSQTDANMLYLMTVYANFIDYIAATSGSLYVPSNTKISSVDTVGLTFTMNANATTTGTTSTHYAFRLGFDNNCKIWDINYGPYGAIAYNNIPADSYEMHKRYSSQSETPGYGAGQNTQWSWWNSSRGSTIPTNYSTQVSLVADVGIGMGTDPAQSPFQPATSGGGIYGPKSVPNITDPTTQLNGHTIGPWCKMTAITRWDSNLNGPGWRHTYCNNVLGIDYKNRNPPITQTMYNPLPAAPNGVIETIGGYRRNCGQSGWPPWYNQTGMSNQRNNWGMFACHGLDRQPQANGLGRFVLTNDSAWTQGGGTLGEIQWGWTAWSPTTVTLGKGLYVGNVNLGAAYLFFIDEANGIAPTLVASGTLAAPSVGFDYYISTTGSDSNTGTLASPWAITAINSKQATYAGKRLGLMAGTYDVSSLMNANNSTALNIQGGLLTGASRWPTYIGACDANGHYAQGVVTLDAYGASGQYGGGNGNRSAIIGQDNYGGVVPTNKGNWTLDGIVLSGFSLWAVHVGSYDGTFGVCPNVTIQNCTFTNGSAQNSTVASGVNVGPLVLYSYSNCAVQNCKFLNNLGWTDNIHFAAMYVWGGLASNPSSLYLRVHQCTFINSGCIYGKTDSGYIYGTTIGNCYFDMTQKTPTGGQSMAIQGFSCPGGDQLRNQSAFHHNIIVGNMAMDLEPQQATGLMKWTTPINCFNNTWILNNTQGSIGPGFRFWGFTGFARFYNNLMYDSGITTGVQYGYMDTNVDGFAFSDYNIYGGLNQFTTRPSGTDATGTATNNNWTQWRTAIGGQDAHSMATAIADPFQNNGPLALQYQINPSGVAYNFSRESGAVSGALVNCGAWDGRVTQIGSTF